MNPEPRHSCLGLLDRFSTDCQDSGLQELGGDDVSCGVLCRSSQANSQGRRAVDRNSSRLTWGETATRGRSKSSVCPSELKPPEKLKAQRYPADRRSSFVSAVKEVGCPTG